MGIPILGANSASDAYDISNSFNQFYEHEKLSEIKDINHTMNMSIRKESGCV